MFSFLPKMSAQRIKDLLTKANHLYEQKKFAAAAKLYRRILKKNPEHFAAKANLAVALFEQENYAASIPYFEDLCRADVANPWWHNYLSQACQKTGNRKQALDEAWRAVVISNGQKEHRLNLAYTIYEVADISGRRVADSILKKWQQKYPHDAIMRQCYKSFYPDENFTCSEAEYVESLFDVFAPDFDNVLADLNYHSPQDIADILAAYFGCNKPAQKRILDLGCGSGLCAQAIKLKMPDNYFVGVDISANMLREAQAKKLYNHLLKCNIFDCAAYLKKPFDMITAADVITYFGAVDKLFALVKNLLRSGGVFVFTVSENTVNQKDFFLMPSSRFVHTPQYIEKTLLKNGFTIWQNKPLVLRTEGEKDVVGRLLLAVAN